MHNTLTVVMPSRFCVPLNASFLFPRGEGSLCPFFRAFPLTSLFPPMRSIQFFRMTAVYLISSPSGATPPFSLFPALRIVLWSSFPCSLSVEPFGVPFSSIQICSIVPSVFPPLKAMCQDFPSLSATYTLFQQCSFSKCFSWCAAALCRCFILSPSVCLSPFPFPSNGVFFGLPGGPIPVSRAPIPRTAPLFQFVRPFTVCSRPRRAFHAGKLNPLLGRHPRPVGLSPFFEISVLTLPPDGSPFLLFAPPKGGPKQRRLEFCFHLFV